jgi:protein-S-isoprenylcysteine O-methyltransferase Ste14
MALRNEFEQSGSWLFAHRSFLPLFALPLLVSAFWTFGYCGGSRAAAECWNGLCLLVAFCGLGIRVLTLGYAPSGTSGRNTRKQVARVLNTTGMYSVVRHPLYFGNYVITAGLTLYFHSLWVLVGMTCLYALYYERIMFAEEAYLRQRFGRAFEEWAAQTPAIVPRLRGWIAPELPFCWRTVLRREYTGFFGIVAVFTALEIIGVSLVEHQLCVEWPWVLLLLLGAAVYLTLRTLKRRTELLSVEGR